MIRDVNGKQLTSSQMHMIRRILDPYFISARKLGVACEADRKVDVNFYRLIGDELACCFCGVARARHRSPSDRKEARAC